LKLSWTTALTFNTAFHIISEQTVLVASYTFLTYFISHSAWRSGIVPKACSCGICGGQSDNGSGFSQVLYCGHQHRATKPPSYSIHVPMMSHDLSNLIKTHSHFKADGLQGLKTFLLILKSLGQLGS
jgi:hypothetical protein